VQSSSETQVPFEHPCPAGQFVGCHLPQPLGFSSQVIAVPELMQ
jgi:hypothetical protein